MENNTIGNWDSYRDPQFLIPVYDLGFVEPQVYKAKKFACKALKGKGARSGIRVIYAYIVEKDEIYLIEMYSKNDKENEDRERIEEVVHK